MILVVLPFCDKDHSNLIRMLGWMKELGGCKDSDCILVYDKNTTKPLGIGSAQDAAISVFNKCHAVQTSIASDWNKWPEAPNVLFLTSAKHVQDNKLGPWLWMEPDCVPMVKGWLQYLERGYAKCGNPFMGPRLDPVSRKVPGLAGVSVYPQDCYSRLQSVLGDRNVPFDMAAGAITEKEGFITPLMLHWWSQKNTPPTFKNYRANDDPKHVKTLDFIPKTCVLFHRCKDGSLIDLLRPSQSPVQDQSSELTVVITSYQRPGHLLKAFDSCIKSGIKNLVIASTGDPVRMRPAFDAINKSKPDTVILEHGNITSNQSWLKGVEAATTKYVTILHDDDLLLPEYIGVVSPGMASDAPFIMVQARNHGVPDYIEKDSIKHGLESSSVLRPRLERKNNLAISPLRGVFLRDDLVKWLSECESLPKTCYLRPGFIVGNDLVIWLKATEKYSKFFNIPKPAVSFGHWDGSTTVHELNKGDRKIFQIYNEARNWNSSRRMSKLHIITIVLDGMPFIKRHIGVFNSLKIPWQWHIVEGAASNTNCTSWCKPQPGRLSKDGTTEYLDQIAAHPNVHLYRNQLWDGKVSMCNAPLKDITEECVLLEVDCDEFWTAQQLEALVEMFDKDRSKNYAMFWCRYFFGPHLVMESRNCYANNPDQDWKRAWRFNPGDKFNSHEPPHLSSESKPFLHRETEACGLVFDHHGYVLKEQVQFKEKFYGYKDAVKHWEKLQEVKCGSVKLSDFLPWVRPEQSGRVKAL